MRRKELPSVVPYPRSSGSTTNLPNVASSLISSVSMFGFSISIIPLSPPLKLTSLPIICYTNSHYHYLFIKRMLPYYWFLKHITVDDTVHSCRTSSCLIYLFVNYYRQSNQFKTVRLHTTSFRWAVSVMWYRC